jgi:alkyl sulfatase BDS1-like metallo-beta-lactamase superfamily hydrolase
VNHVKGDWEVYEVVFLHRPCVVFVPARLWPKDSEEIIVDFLLELRDLVLLSHDINLGVINQARVPNMVVPDVLVVDTVQVT